MALDSHTYYLYAPNPELGLIFDFQSDFLIKTTDYSYLLVLNEI